MKQKKSAKEKPWTCTDEKQSNAVLKRYIKNIELNF